MHPNQLCHLPIIVTLMLWSFPLYAEGSVNQSNWLTLIWENDFIADDDSGYTNGIGVAWGNQYLELENHKRLYNFAQALPGFIQRNRHYALTYRFAQAMFTPGDIKAQELIPDDRPYAGLLLASTHLQSYDAERSLRYWLTVGIVGPASGAESVQKAIHQLIGTNTPNGWDNQLKNEFVFSGSVEYLRRLHVGNTSNGLEYDTIFMTGTDVGTLHSELGVGLGIRAGQSLARSFPAASLVPGRNINPLAGSLKQQWHVFINIYPHYVFNDVPIEGNWSRESHGVTLRPQQLIVSIGGAYSRSDWGFGASLQDSSRTFEERPENSLFANFSLTLRF